MKKSWNKPELTVLVRTRPEEAVLETCKINGYPKPASSTDSNTSCFVLVPPCGPCRDEVSS